MMMVVQQQQLAVESEKVDDEFGGETNVFNENELFVIANTPQFTRPWEQALRQAVSEGS